MPIPLRVQLFDSFLGSQEGIHSIILPDIFSSGGSKNLWIDKYGRAKKIDGYAKQNAVAVTTNTGASATLLRELFSYRSSSAGSFTRHIIGCFDDGVDEFEIWRSTDSGETWTFLQDLGAGSVGVIPDFAQIGNTLIFCDGTVAPRTYDGTTWATAGGTQLAAPTLSGTTSGNLSGNYKWKVLPIYAGGVRNISSAASASTSIVDQQRTVTWTQDASATGYEVYRTTGTGAIYYFVDNVDGSATVTYVDNVADINLLENRVLQEHGDAPPTGSYFCEAHKQRMWYGRTDTNPRRVYWSDPGDPDSVHTDNYLEFGDAETLGDVVTGMLGDYEGHMVVFTERSIWTVSGTGQIIGNIIDWSRTKTNAQIGTVSKRSVARVPAGSKYADAEGNMQITRAVSIAYWTPLGDIRLFDGENDVVISHPKKDDLLTFNYSQREKIFCIPDIERAEITWCYATGSNSEPDTAVTWNYRWGVWYERSWNFSCGLSTETASDANLLLGGSNATSRGGFAYELWSGNSFDGSNIEAIWMTKTLYGVNDQNQPALAHTKRFRWADLLFLTDSLTTLTIEWMSGHTPDLGAATASQTFSPAAYSILTQDIGDTIITATGDTMVLASSSSQIRVPLASSSGDYIHDTGIRLRVGDNAQNGSWSLEAMSLAYQILPGLKRRFQET